MKSLVYTAPYCLEMQDYPVPAPGPTDVLVRIKAVGICGSDVQGYTGTTGRRSPPLIMGHEAAGIVAKIGSEVSEIEVGDRVCFDSTIYCNACHACKALEHNRCIERSVLGVGAKGMKKRHGAMAEYVSVPWWVLHVIPPSLSFETAALLEPVSIGLHAVSQALPIRDKHILIIGAGPIGLSILMGVKTESAASVTVTDIDTYRLGVAQSMGADCAVHPDHIADAIGPQGVSVTFEAVGVPESLASAIDATSTGGRIVLVGNVTSTPPFDIQQVISKELTLTGSYASAGEYAIALAKVARGVMDPTPLISGVFPLEHGATLFERLLRRKENLLKILLTP